MMAEEVLNIPADANSLEYHIVTLFEKLDALRRENGPVNVCASQPPMRVEVRTLEFWRSIISECLASFFYVFIVCGAVAGAETSGSSPLLAAALASGFAMATLNQCFGYVSGGQVNPATTLAMAVTRRISPVRAAMFITAQCGGAIAGAALLYGVTSWNYSGATPRIGDNPILAWQRFGVEFVLTFVVVFAYFVSMDTYRRWMGSSAITIGFAYAACTFVSMPNLNPARALGPAFVWDRWEQHWVQWLGPTAGGALAGLIYEFILSPRRQARHRRADDSLDGGDSSSVQSDEDAYDDLDKRPEAAGAGSGASPGSRAPAAPPPFVGGAATRLERVESLYGGTRSLYCKSPPLTRANLHRSQSVYAKTGGPSSSAASVGREPLGRPGPLVPAVSLYPIRLHQHQQQQQQQQQSHVQNQNAQNLARSGGHHLQQPPPPRPESVYGTRRAAPPPSAHSDDSSYGSYRGAGTAGPLTYHHSSSYHHSPSPY